MQDSSLHFPLHDSKYSFNNTPGLDSNRSPTSEIVSLRKIKHRGSEKRIFNKLVPQNLHGGSSYSSKLDHNLPKSNFLLQRKSELAQITDTNDTNNKHYFNEKFIDDRQTKIHNKLWVGIKTLPVTESL